MEPDNKQAEKEPKQEPEKVNSLLPSGQTVDQLRQEIQEQFPEISLKDLEALGF